MPSQKINIMQFTSTRR